MSRPRHWTSRRAALIFAVALPVLLCAYAAEAASPVIERLNRDRAGRDLPRLESDERLDAVARAVAADMSLAGSADSIDSDRIARRLKDEGYVPRLVVSGYVTGADNEERLAAQWPALDPSTWRRMLDPSLRHVALARGATVHGRFYLLLGAVSQNDAKAAESEGLADLKAVRERVLELTNEYRRAEGLLDYRRDAGLDGVAQDYAEEMLRRGFYGHVSPEGKDVMDRVRAGNIRVQRVGENLAEGPPTPEMVMDGWYNSPSHQQNLLHKGFRRLGVGVAAGMDPDGVFKIYWVQVFSSQRRPIL